MKKTMGKLKQALSIVLAVAMIVTCLPQTGISVMAAEDQSAESFGEPDVSVDTAEDETNESNESASVEDEADEPEEADTEEKEEEEAENETENGIEEAETEEAEENEIMTLAEAVTVTIKKVDADNAVTNIMYTTAANWKGIDVSKGDADVTLESGSSLKIKFDLKNTHKAEVKAGAAGQEKAVTPASGVYTVTGITADSNVIITATPIQYTIETLITVDGKNVTKAEIKEIEDGIKEEFKDLPDGEETLIEYNVESLLNKGEDLEFELWSLPPDEIYYVKSVQCKVGSVSKEMTYYDDYDEETEEGGEYYKLTAADITKNFPKLQDGDAITVVINMEKAWKVTFDLEGVAVRDITNISDEAPEGSMVYSGTKYVKKGAPLALSVDMDGGPVQLREAWYQAGTKKTDIKSKVNANGLGYGNKFSIAITADTIITIKSTIDLYALEFNNNNSEIIKVSDVKLGGKDVSDNDLRHIRGSEVTSQNKITFRADADAGYKKPVVDVEENRGSEDTPEWVRVKTLTPTAAGIYELTSLNADSKITITNAGLDDKTCNVLNIAPATQNLSNAYTATLTVSGNEVKDLKSTDTYLAPLEEAEAVLTINLQPGYENLVVKLDGDPAVTGNNPAGYTITFTKDRKVQNITVSAEAKTAGDDMTIKFIRTTAPHMSYKVIQNDSVKQVTDGGVSNTYEISKNGRAIQFTVTAANAYYEPQVKLCTAIRDPIAPISVNPKTRTYTYSVAAENLKDRFNPGVIYIKETPAVREVTVKYDEKAVKVSADVAGGVQNPQELNKGKDTEVTAVYSVTGGDTINFTVSVKDNYKLENITAKNKTTGKETKVTKNNISVKADADYDVTVKTQALTAINVYEGKSTDADKKVPVNKNKSYSVQYGTDYTVEVYNGADTAELKYAYFAYGIRSTATINDGGETVTVEIDREDAVNINKPKQLTLTLKDADKTAYTVILELIPLAKVKKVDGVKTVNKENILTQTVNTTKAYAITMDPATAAVTLGARVTEQGTGVTAYVKGRMLEIKTATDTAAAKLATIELYDSTASEEASKAPALYTLTVTTVLPTLPTPTVALQSADDTRLMLTLGAKNLALPDSGKVYYKVVVTPDEKATAKLTNAQQEKVKKSVTQYFEVNGVDSKGSTSQMETVNVIDAKSGSGFANKFDVTVTLVQSIKGRGIGQIENEKTNKLTESMKSVTKKGLATKEPAYATKITFTKGASAVYTNQSDVLAATAVFDKNATYTTLIGEGSGAPKDLSYTGDDSDKALEISIENGNQILVSATPKTALGKHVIRVTADNGAGKGADTMRQTTADYTVTVERAIENIELAAPMVYKAPGKAASFTVGIAYNEGTTQPKAKKVNWTITDEKGNELSKEEARGVTVKNGKVTIPKDYIMTEDDGEEGMCDFVYVKATAADVTANLRKGEPASYVAEVYIYNWAVSMGEAILVKGIGEPDGGAYKELEVIARSGGTVTAKQLKGARVIVLKRGVEDKDRYTNNDLYTKYAVNEFVDMTFKTSNKAIVLGEGGYVEEVNGGNLKNVTITATTADGSNLKSELKNLKVNYYEPKEYGLAVKQMTPWDDIETQVLHQDNAMYDFSGALDTVFELQVMELLEDEWDELSAASNYTLAVTGASILEKDVIKGTYKIIGSNKEITVKLTDKTKKTNNVTTYKLHNKTVSTAQASKLTATPNSNLIAGTHRGDQQIKYSLTGFKGDPKETRVLITLDAKDSTNIKNQARYEAFARDCNKFLNNTDYTVEELQNGGLVFGTEGSTDIPAGTYKLTVNFGSFDDKGDFFVAIAKPVTLTIKVSAPKKASVKLNNKYTLSIHNAVAGAPVTLNNKNVILTAVSVVNDNVNGKENNFTKYFEITEEEDGTFVLRIKNDLSIADLNYIKDTKKAKNDLTGWVTYTYDDGIFEPETMQAQITIAGYAEPKYSMDSGNVISGEGMTVDLSARANGNKIAVEHAYTEAPTLAVTGIADGNVRFTVKGNAKTQNVYIVPDTSAYTKALEELSEAIETAEEGDGKKAAETAYADAVKACGVMVKVTVTVK